MQIETVTIETDTTPLDGLLYLPDPPPDPPPDQAPEQRGEDKPEAGVTGAVQLMHGNTMNFYVGPPRFLPPYLTSLGLACLAYNRRGHDVLSNRDSRDLEGGAYQTIAEAVEDNRLARRWMDERGLPAPFVIGHSNGGMLAVRHVQDHPDTPGLALLSAHRGGRRILRLMAENGLMAGDRYDEITAEARRLVDAGQGGQLMVVPGWWYVISANTYVEYLDECPDIVELAPGIPCPSLFIRSREEPAEMYPAEEIAARSPHPVSVEVLDVGGHYYVGHEDTVADTVVGWLSALL